MSDAAKHTPGPWYATTRKGSWDWVVAHGPLDEICQLFHDGTEFNETGEANARLIAAAPEMLEALLSIRTIAAYMMSDPAGASCLKHIGEIAQAAIAKAEGK